jgi:hypothetical protein
LQVDPEAKVAVEAATKTKLVRIRTPIFNSLGLHTW